MDTSSFISVRHTKAIGFFLLLVFWLPGMFIGDAFGTRSEEKSNPLAEVELEAASFTLPSAHAEILSHPRLQHAPITGRHAFVDGLSSNDAGDDALVYPAWYVAALPSNPTATFWHLVNPTRFARAPSV